MSLIYPRRKTRLTIHLLASHYYPMFWWRCKPYFRIMSDFRKLSAVSVRSRTIFVADDIDLLTQSYKSSKNLKTMFKHFSWLCSEYLQTQIEKKKHVMFPRMRVDDDVSVYKERVSPCVISLNLCETRYTSQRKVHIYPSPSSKDLKKKFCQNGKY